jgi:homocysteine S-methyltransferase
MRNPIEPYLSEKGYVLLDGALATELERHGADLNDPLWSAKLLLDAPEAIEAVNTAYLQAGADIATTATYQATYEGLAGRGLGEDDANELLRLAVDIARQACHRHGRGLVVASIGCYGAFLHDGSEYRGDYGLSRDELMDFHRKRLRVLIEAEPDLVAFETIPCLVEAEAIVALLDEIDDTAAWMSFSCRNDSEVSHGELFADCVHIADASPQVIAVGMNCTPPQYVSPLLRSASEATAKPFVAYPNSGEGWDAVNHRWIPAEDECSIVDHVEEWLALGARLVGGCCRTTPDTIRAIDTKLRPIADRR